MAESRAVFFNGLGTGEASATLKHDFETLKSHGVQVEETAINWQSGEPFPELLDRMIDMVRDRIQLTGDIALIGASAGGSLAINVFSRLQNERITAFNLCGRLRRGNLSKWDLRSLERSAHLGTRRASQSFCDSVEFCEDIALPKLNEEDKKRIAVVKPVLDFVVPRDTMDIEGVEPIIVPVISHRAGISRGLKQLAPEH